MQDEQDRLVAAVAADPRYEALVARRSRLGWTLSAVIFLIVDGNLWWNSVVDLDEEIWNFGKVTANEDTVRIEVNARQWAWQARYAGADGEFATPDDVTTLNTIPVPVDTPILVHLASPDVIHSFYLPNLRQKMDAVSSEAQMILACFIIQSGISYLFFLLMTIF